MEHRGPGVEAQLRVRLELGIVPAPFRVHLAWTMCSLKIRPKPGSASIRSLALPDTRRSASEISNRRTEVLVLNLRQAYALAGPARAAWQRRAYGALLGNPAELRTDRPRAPTPC
jgi:hypothetical protein